MTDPIPISPAELDPAAALPGILPAEPGAAALAAPVADAPVAQAADPPAGDLALPEPSGTPATGGDIEPADTPAAAGEAEPGAMPASAAPVPSASSGSDPASDLDITARMKSLFPALFTGGPKPIKLRIQDDIQARAPGQFTKRQLSAFFRRHTTSTGYLIALSKARQRFGLDGEGAGDISEEHRQIAREELNRRRAKRDEQREVEEQQRRNRATLLRDFETNKLTTANFCALKGIEPAALDGYLEQARHERAEAPPEPPRPGMRPGPLRGERGERGERNDRPVRQERRDGDGRRDERAAAPPANAARPPGAGRPPRSGGAPSTRAAAPSRRPR